MQLRPHLASVLLLPLAVACTTAERRIDGQLAQGKFNLVNAQVVAISADGKTYRSPVAADGAFSLAVPVGGDYTLRFANSTQQAGVLDAFAVLVSRDALGLAYRHFKVNAGAPINLGSVSPVAVKSSGLTLASDDDADTEDGDDGADSDDGDSDSDEGDDDTSEDDVEHACDLGGGSDLTVVESEHGMLAQVDSDEDGVSDDEDSDDDSEAACDATQRSSSDDSDSDSDSEDDCEVEDEPGDEVCGGGPAGGSTGGGSTGTQDPGAATPPPVDGIGAL